MKKHFKTIWYGFLDFIYFMALVWFAMSTGSELPRIRVMSHNPVFGYSLDPFFIGQMLVITVLIFGFAKTCGSLGNLLRELKKKTKPELEPHCAFCGNILDPDFSFPSKIYKGLICEQCYDIEKRGSI